MVRKSYTPEQITNKLREAEILLRQPRVDPMKGVLIIITVS